MSDVEKTTVKQSEQKPTNKTAAELQKQVKTVESKHIGNGTLTTQYVDPHLSLYRKIQQVQVRMPPIEKNASGYNYRYATLGGILQAVNPAFEALGLMSYSVTAQVEINDHEYDKLTTYVVDLATGVEVHAEHTWPYTPDPQKQGSYETYYRRYSLISLLNLPIKDDDAAAAHRASRRPMPRPMNTNRISERNQQ